MIGIRRFSTALASPGAWANYPILRVERRFDGRPGMPRAFLFADENGEVIPTVYFFRNRIHNSEPRRENAFKTMEYPDVDAVVAAGWRPYSDEELDIPINGETPPDVPINN